MKARSLDYMFYATDDPNVIDRAVRVMAPYMTREDYCTDPAGMYGDLKETVGDITARRIMRELFPSN